MEKNFPELGSLGALDLCLWLTHLRWSCISKKDAVLMTDGG